jgi:hypothetical protein
VSLEGHKWKTTTRSTAIARNAWISGRKAEVAPAAASFMGLLRVRLQ